MAPREVEIEVEDGESFVADLEQAVAGGAGIFWVTDKDGVRHGIAADKIAFVEIEARESHRGVGFSGS